MGAAGSILPEGPLTPLPRPPVSRRLHPSPAVPATPVLDELRGVVGDRNVITEADRLLVYESDGLTQYRVPPSAVVLPGTVSETMEVVQALHRAQVPFVPRGAGTGLSGGALAMDGAVVVGTARLNRILEIDPVRRRARVEPGVVNQMLTRRTRPQGLIYAPDPSSQSACTLGGNVAENSGGPHCLKYGVTSRYVTELDIVLPDGSLHTLGPDLSGLVVGSEGCFGIVTAIEVALIPEPPAVRTLLGIFPSVEAAGLAVTRIMAGGLLPAALEIVDQETIKAVEASVFAAGYPVDAGAALVVEFDGVDAGLDQEVDQAREACLEAGASSVRTARSDAERTALWAGRKKAFGAMGRIAPDLLVQDATVPRSRLPDVLARIGEIAARHRLTVANVFHAGDGNLHPNLLFDRRNADQLARVEAASGEIMDVCIEAGGTITGEHGVGVDKRRYMSRVYDDPTLQLMAEVKAAFDPAGLCNPGKVLPDEVLAAGRRAVRHRRAGKEMGPETEVSAPLPDQVLEHSPDDLVVRVGAGTSLAELDRAVRPSGQWLPLDPPGGLRARIGALFLEGGRAPLERGFGRLRDHVLGISGHTRGGRPFRLGGTVVKNVAGFDLIRFLCGTGDRLVRIEEMSLRLFPLPEADITLLHRGTPDQVLELARDTEALPLPLSALEVVWPESLDTPVLACRLMGSRLAVEWMAGRIRDTWSVPASGPDPADAPFEGEASAGLWMEHVASRASEPSPARASDEVFWASATGQRLQSVFTGEGVA